MKNDPTQLGQKALNVFKKIVKRDVFEKEVIRVREVLGLPVKGFVLDKNKSDFLITSPDREESNFIAKDLHFQRKNPYPDQVKRLERMLPFCNNYFSLLIRNYVYYNKFFYKELSDFMDKSDSACIIMDAEEESEYFSLDDNPNDYQVITAVGHNRKVNDLIFSYPITLRLKPGISQRDFVDYIKNNWHKIEEYQKKYKDNSVSFKNSKVKKNDKIEERNDFIYKNRELPRKEISSLVKKKFRQIVDYGTVGKIISRENKKRIKCNTDEV